MSIGGGGDTGQADAAAANSQQTINEVNPKLIGTGDDALDFTKNFFSQYITPLIGQLNDATQTAQDRNTTIFNQQQAQAADFQQTYDSEGKPAIDNYFQTAQDFSTDQFADTQARLGIGDVRNQQANQEASQARAIQATGGNAASPASMAIKSQSGVTYANAAAAQAARARDLANTQKLNLQSSAANLGVTIGQQATTQTNAAATTVGQGAAIPAQNLQAASQAQTAQYAGYDAASSAYGTALNAASGRNTSAVNTAVKAGTDEDAGWGSLLGTVAGAAIKYGPAIA